MADTLDMTTLIAANLHSLYDERSGADAVADESVKLQRRGWLVAKPLGTRAHRDVVETAPTSPMVTGPRGAQERKDGELPRGVADDGHPRIDLFTCDSGEKVESSARVGLGGPDRESWPIDETKPRSSDACVDTMVLWCLADLLGVSVLMILFDYKYFFHTLAYEMAEV